MVVFEWCAWCALFFETLEGNLVVRYQFSRSHIHILGTTFAIIKKQKYVDSVFALGLVQTDGIE
jgi:hypothetical protein